MKDRFAPIRKPPMGDVAARPNLDYPRDVSGFDWQQAIDGLDWLPDGRLNMASEAVDRHALRSTTRDNLCMIWEGRHGEREDYTFGRMREETDRFANVLRSLGIGVGDRVFILLDRVPEFAITFFGILKVGGVAAPVPYGCDPERLKTAMRDTGCKVLVTQPDRRIAITPIIPHLFELQHIVVVNKGGRDPAPLDYQDLSYEEEMSKARTRFEVVPVAENSPAFIDFRFGDDGSALGVVHGHGGAVQYCAVGKWALDLHPDDVYWGAGGTIYGSLAAWTNGVTQLVCEGGGGARSWYQMIESHGVTVSFATRREIGMLLDAGGGLRNEFDLSQLRFLASDGGQRDPLAVMRAHETLGMVIHDGWGQAETGGTLCANYASMDVRPGSVGCPIPGTEFAVLDDEFKPLGSEREGRMAVRPGWPSMFLGYWGRRDVYESRFRRGWYTTGERAYLDEDGFLWLAGDGE